MPLDARRHGHVRHRAIGVADHTAQPGGLRRGHRQRRQRASAHGGGKTGTAQWGGSGLDLPTHAWFVFFAPFAKPDVAMSIFVERGELSEVEAAPIAVQVMRYFNANRQAIEAA